MGYVIVLCIVVVAAFVATAIVLGRDGGEREARYFTELEPEQQSVLYREPVDEPDGASWRQRGFVRDIEPQSDGTARVDVMWYNSRPDRTVRDSETNVEHFRPQQAQVRARGVRKGDFVTIDVHPGQGVRIVAD